MKINGAAATTRRKPPCALVGIRLVVVGRGRKEWRDAATWPFDPERATDTKAAEDWVRRQVADKGGWRMELRLDVTADALRAVAE